MGFIKDLLFPATPKITPPAATPTRSTSSVDAAGAGQVAKRRDIGRASTVLTLGQNNQTTTAAAQLLGQ